MTTMTNVFFTEIRDNRERANVAEIFERARLMGYDLVKFNGWTDFDLGPSGMPGPRYVEAKENGQRIREIVRTFDVDVSIFQTVCK